jgi:hypothetical protein
MIAQKGGLGAQLQSIKDWLIKDLLKLQKPELDRKIDEMLKPPKRIIQKYLGLGKSIGRKIKGAGLGKSISRRLKTLKLL